MIDHREAQIAMGIALQERTSFQGLQNGM